jgi:hypothetical protein
VDDYLDEFTFRFNAQASGHRGKLFTSWCDTPSTGAPRVAFVKQVRPRHHEV